MNWRFREPVNSLTHLSGFALSIAGLVLLVRAGAQYGGVARVVSFSIFGASLILLYAASTLYHWLRLSERGTRVLKRLDHIAIFVLIAGTYTPICLVPLWGAWGWSLLVSVWGLALAGVVLKLLWLHAPRWLSTVLYVLMGWLVAVAVVPMLHTVPPGGLWWLLAGGLFYTVGAIIYASKWPNPLPRRFGFHEIWHLFVLAGSFSQFWSIFRYMTHLG